MVRKINLTGEITAVQGSEGGGNEADSWKTSGSWSDTTERVVLLAERTASRDLKARESAVLSVDGCCLNCPGAESVDLRCTNICLIPDQPHSGSLSFGPG